MPRPVYGHILIIIRKRQSAFAVIHIINTPPFRIHCDRTNKNSFYFISFTKPTAIERPAYVYLLDDALMTVSVAPSGFEMARRDVSGGRRRPRWNDVFARSAVTTDAAAAAAAATPFGGGHVSPGGSV